MTDANIEQLKLEFRNAVVKALAEQGSTFFGNLKAMFKERGLTDEIMQKIIDEVVSGK